MIFLIPLILLIVYLIFSFVKKEFNPLKWFKKEGNDVKIQSIKFVTGTDKESVISNYTEKIFVIVTIEKNNPDIERVDVIRINGNKKQTIILNFNENEAIFEIDEDEDLTNKQQYIVDYKLKEKPSQIFTANKQIKLNTEQVKNIEQGEPVILQISNIKPDVNIIETKANISYVDVTLEEDPKVNIFGSSNVYFNPLTKRDNFHIIKDGIKQGVDTQGNLIDNGDDNIFKIINYGNHQYIGDEKNRILYLDNDEIKIKDMAMINNDELSQYKVKIKFTKKKY